MRPVKGLLIIGGEGPDAGLFEQCRQGASIVVAADSGLESALALGVEPDLVVGDMDSLRDRTLLSRFPPERRMIYSVDKDETDTEIGLGVLQQKGCDEVIIAGGGGGRIDHLLGILMLFERANPPRRWITEKEDIRLVEGVEELIGCRGSIVSLFPLGESATDMASEGLKWPLQGLTFRRGRGGISNVVTADAAWIRIGRGRLLLVRSESEAGAC
jgi:thiamine pyrophosphokinase